MVFVFVFTGSMDVREKLNLLVILYWEVMNSRGNFVVLLATSSFEF